MFFMVCCETIQGENRTRDPVTGISRHVSSKYADLYFSRLRGKPASGKSTLMKYIHGELMKAREAAYAKGANNGRSSLPLRISSIVAVEITHSGVMSG
jgi:ABC-type Mn2+/Zn2+ transport system ATPase subunit